MLRTGLRAAPPRIAPPTRGHAGAGAVAAGLVVAGQLNRLEFKDGIRRQMGLFVQRRLSGLMEDGAGRETETHVY